MTTQTHDFDFSGVQPSPDRMPAVMARFRADRACLERLFGDTLSPSRRARLRRFFGDWRQGLEALPFAALTRSDRADWLLLRGLLEAQTCRLDREEERFALAEPLLPFAAAVFTLEERRREMRDIVPEEAARQLDQVHAQIRRLQAGLTGPSAESVPAAAAAWASQAASRLRGTLEAWFGFYHGHDPVFSWWVERPYRALDLALGEYAVFLREQVAGAGDETILGDPIGADGLAAELRFAQVPYAPEELIAAAHREMAWCRREMRRAARDLGHGDDWKAALEQVKSDHAAPGGQPALVRDLADEAIRYVEAHDLVTVPALAKECWRMEMMSPERQKVNPFFLGGETIMVSFPTDAMEHAQKQMSLRGNNRAFARATVQHELIPGHHLQMFSQERHRSERRIFSTPFWTEGWTMHWEMLLWERGFARTPQERIGMLFWRQHRCARVLFSLRFHLGQMTAEDCVEMLVCDAGHERDNARAEVRRSFEGGYDPLYQCAYLVGGWQMHALYREAVGGGRMTDREFHDAVLRENCMPIAMLRALLTDRPLERDSRADWRFLGPTE